MWQTQRQNGPSLLPAAVLCVTGGGPVVQQLGARLVAVHGHAVQSGGAALRARSGGTGARIQHVEAGG